MSPMNRAPESGGRNPAAILRRVVFPDPLGPSRVTNSPLSTSSETGLSARTEPKDLVTSRKLSGRRSASMRGALRGQPAAGDLDTEEQQQRDREEDCRGDGSHGRKLDPDSFPNFYGQRLCLNPGQKDRHYDLVERGYEGKGGAASQPRQDERQSHGSEHAQGRCPETLRCASAVRIDAA